MPHGSTGASAEGHQVGAVPSLPATAGQATHHTGTASKNEAAVGLGPCHAVGSSHVVFFWVLPVWGDNGTISCLLRPRGPPSVQGCNGGQP